MPEVISIGETMAVMNPSTTGPMRYVHSFVRTIGGAESNVAIGVVRLGHSAGWISRVGDDEFGRYVWSTIRGEGVDVSGVHFDATAPTGVYFKERSASGATSVFYYRKGSAASRLSLKEVDPVYLRTARILHVTGITPALSRSCRETVLTAMEMARAEGVMVCFDPNMRWKLWSADQARPVFLEMARRADIVLPGSDEGELIVGSGDPVDISRGLMKLGVSKVAVKLGPRGAYGMTLDQTCEVSSAAVQPVDPVGAGDAFAAAFLAAELEGLPLPTQLHHACAAGAMVTQIVGDWEGFPTRAQLTAYLSKKESIGR